MLPFKDCIELCGLSHTEIRYLTDSGIDQAVRESLAVRYIEARPWERAGPK